MKPVVTLTLLLLCIMSPTVLASIFLDKMNKLLDTPSLVNLQQLLAWQWGGIIVPLAAGPGRVLA